jgi:hypothetical protein
MRRTYLLNILVVILLVVGLLVSSAATALSSTTVKLWIGNASMSVNGVQQPIDAQGTTPVVVAGRTLVPIRAVIEAFGGICCLGVLYAQGQHHAGKGFPRPLD